MKREIRPDLKQEFLRKFVWHGRGYTTLGVISTGAFFISLGLLFGSTNSGPVMARPGLAWASLFVFVLLTVIPWVVVGVRKLYLWLTVPKKEE